MSAILRWSFAGLSVALLGVLGMLGEEARALATLATPKCGAASIAALPDPTRLAFDLYGLHSGHFFLSLTPFMIVFAAIAAISRGATPAATTLARLALVWLAALGYFGLFAWAMLLPFQPGCADLEDKPIAWIVLAIDALLVVAAAAVYRRAAA